MSDDKKKDADPKAEAGKKKKGLPPVVMIAVGAILGGAGAVFAIPPKKVEVKVEEKKHEFNLVEHPDKIEITFNPTESSGKAYCSVTLGFIYEVRDDREEEAIEAMKANWRRNIDRVYELLMARTVRELKSQEGRAILRRELGEQMDRTLFPGKGEAKVARITEVLIEKCVQQ